MGNTCINQSHISEGCKYYTYFNGYLLTVCCFDNRQPNQWFQSIRLNNSKLLSIKDRYGNEYRSHGMFRVGHSIRSLRYYTTVIAAQLNLNQFVYQDYYDVINYQPVGELFILYGSDEHYIPVAKYLVDSARSGIIIAYRMDGKWQFCESQSTD